MSEETIRSKGGLSEAFGAVLIACESADEGCARGDRDAMADGCDQSQSRGDIVQSSSRIWMAPGEAVEGGGLLSMFVRRTLEMTCSVSVARTSQPKERRASLETEG